MSERTEGLRALADWLDAHPDYDDVAVGGRFDIFFYRKQDLVDFKRQSGATRLGKNGNGAFFWLTLDFGGGVKIDANVAREKACRRVVVGTKDVPEEIVPAHTEEIIEWECDPLLEDVAA